MTDRFFRPIAILALLPIWFATPAAAQFGPPSPAQVAAMKAAAAKLGGRGGGRPERAEGRLAKGAREAIAALVAEAP